MDERNGMELIVKARQKIMEACYSYQFDFDGSVGDYNTFYEFLIKETHMRPYLEYYFIDQLAKSPNDINALLEFLYFAKDAAESPSLLKSYFEETAHLLLEIPQLKNLHDTISVIDEAFHTARDNKEEFNVEDVGDEAGIAY